MEKKIDIKNRYSHEINEIKNILKDLDNGRYYEHSGAKMDGALSINIQKLRKNLNELIDKIEYNKDSTSEEIGKIMSEIEI